MEDLTAFSAKPRLRLLLDHFAKITDSRQAWKVAYPLREVLFLVVCGTIATPAWSPCATAGHPGSGPRSGVRGRARHA